SAFQTTLQAPIGLRPHGSVSPGEGGSTPPLFPPVRRSPRMRIRYTLVLSLVSLLAVATAAMATTGFFASLSGIQEVPPNGSPGTGTGTFIVDNAGTSMSYSVTFSGLVG